MSITDTTIDDNAANDGYGGGFMASYIYGGDLTITNSSITDNSAYSYGGGFYASYLNGTEAGLTIIGLGTGTRRPRFDFDHANASIDITANDVTLENITLLPSVTAVLIGIDVNAGVTDTVIRNCESLPGEDGAGVDEFALTVDIKAGCTRTLIDGCKDKEPEKA